VYVKDPDSPGGQRRIRRLLNTLLTHSVACVVAPDDLIESLYPTIAARPVITANVWQPTTLPQVTTVVTALNAGHELRDVLEFGPQRIAIIDADQPDPDWPRQDLRNRAYATEIGYFLGLL
jgi:hypothetical protein